MFNGLVVYGGGAVVVEEVRLARSSRYLSSWWRRLSEGFILKLFECPAGQGPVVLESEKVYRKTEGGSGR